MKDEASIGSDAKLANVGRHVGKAGIQQFHAPIPGSGVPGAEFGVPEIRRIGFDTQQGIVGSLTAIAGIVADLGAVLVSEDRHHRTVEIEDKARAMLRLVNEVLQQSIIDAMELFPEAGRRLE